MRYWCGKNDKKCGNGAAKYSVWTTYVRQVTSPCLAFLRATGDAAVDDTGLGRLTTNISINYSISKTVKQINWLCYKGRRVYYTSNYSKLSVWSHDLSRDSCSNYSAIHHACRITRPNMQREKESGIKWDQVGSSGIKWDQLLLCRCGLKRFWSNGVVWCEFLFVVRFFVKGAIWCDKPASGAVPHQPHQNMVPVRGGQIVSVTKIASTQPTWHYLQFMWTSY